MAASPVSNMRRREYKTLQEEHERLLKTLVDDESQTLEDWMLLPEETRDVLAARALVQSDGRWWVALGKLGFKLKEWSIEPKKKLRIAVLETPGVKARLTEDLSKFENLRARIVGRQAEIALYGKEEQSQRAAQFVAKVAGWMNDSPAQTNVTVNLAALVAARDGTQRVRATEEPLAIEAQDPFALLAHDPGEPVRIDSGDDAVLEAIEGQR